ncbi:TIR domain-containing protein [Paraglaciecola arctica]|nr:hypothetical protein [Paraglaciecola arctica]
MTNDKKKAFVLMPFSNELTDVYKHLICEGLNDYYEVSRADDIKSQNNILKDIVVAISTSDLIVADLTDSNPNVYYELGIAHALQKDVVLLIQDIEELPFDLRSYRVIPYSLHFAKMNNAKKELLEIAKGAFKDSIPFGNPVKDFSFQVSKSTTVSISEALNIDSDIESYGLWDHQIEMEEKFKTLMEILDNVSEILLGEVVPEISETTKLILSSADLPTKDRRNFIVKLAKCLDKFSFELSKDNERYRTVINDLGTNIEFVLVNGTSRTLEPKKEITKFISEIDAVEKGASEGRKGFSSFLQSIKDVPNMTSALTSANRNMQKEVESFIDNIDQTISMSVRARTIGRDLLSKITA